MSDRTGHCAPATQPAAGHVRVPHHMLPPCRGRAIWGPPFQADGSVNMCDLPEDMRGIVGALFGWEGQDHEPGK